MGPKQENFDAPTETLKGRVAVVTGAEKAWRKPLATEIATRGIRSKLRKMRDGRIGGGAKYSEGSLAYLLRNVLYIGKIRHGDNVYEGEHHAIISAEPWEASQALLSGKA